jgi:hypothetical protein
VIAAFGVLFPLPVLGMLSFMGMIIAGFVFVRLGPPVRHMRAALDAGRAVGGILVVLDALIWIYWLGSAVATYGWSRGGSELHSWTYFVTNFVASLAIVVVGALLGAGGGLIAAAMRQAPVANDWRPADLFPPPMPPDPPDPNDPWGR